MAKTFSVALSDELMARLQAEVDATGKARNAVVREALDRFLIRPPAPADKPQEAPQPKIVQPVVDVVDVPQDCICGHRRDRHAAGPGCRLCPCVRSF